MRVAGGGFGAGLLALLVAGVVVPGLVLGHGSRTVGEYELVVGFIGEPVAAGQRSGLELEVTRGHEPVMGLEASLLAEVRYGGARLDLPLSPRSGAPGWYESAFTPTAAGRYEFHVSGSIGDTPIDETFASGRDGFDDVGEVSAGQFPVAQPPIVEVADDAKRGAGAADLLPLAFVLGAVGAVSGLLALGIALAGRGRPG
ncbi:MAG: hypothetical protein L0221_07690 [Chloroflexi bacterium]|nr:hypothetical protein [Chloroflexota bacterium]